MLLERLFVVLIFLSTSNFSTFLSIFYNIYSCRFHTLTACFGMNASPSSFLSSAQVRQSSSFPGKHPERSFSKIIRFKSLTAKDSYDLQSFAQHRREGHKKPGGMIW
jgi:hypothetical protein